jgi:hypothetical protein
MQGDFFNQQKKQRDPSSNKPKRPKRNSGKPNANVSPPGPPTHGVLQPLAAMVVSKSGRLQCPPPIVAMRALMASTPLCKAIRPQSVPFKLVACGFLSALANIPPGMVKTHFEKFSPGWFVAIHLSIPFVACLRKAVVLPPGALAITIGGAIAGLLSYLLMMLLTFVLFTHLMNRCAYGMIATRDWILCANTV